MGFGIEAVCLAKGCECISELRDCAMPVGALAGITGEQSPCLSLLCCKKE